MYQRVSNNDVGAITSGDVAAVASLTYREDVWVRSNAYAILARADGTDRVAPLLRGLDDADEQTRLDVRNALMSIADPALLSDLLRREATAEKPEDASTAGAILEGNADQKAPVLAPLLIVALDDKDVRVRTTAWKRVRQLARDDGEDLGAFEAAGDDKARLPSVQRAALWWWKRAHPKAWDLKKITAALGSATPAERSKAAKRLGDLAAPELRSLATDELKDALALAASVETEEFVQRQELASLGALVGRDFSWKDGAPKEEKARVLALAKDWRGK
ncbi:hypothetical protein HY251_10925 [bacterium]|nr:hypothetical protein [bacterium]